MLAGVACLIAWEIKGNANTSDQLLLGLTDQEDNQSKRTKRERGFEHCTLLSFL
jgi:hypothetical protein